MAFDKSRYEFYRMYDAYNKAVTLSASTVLKIDYQELDEAAKDGKFTVPVGAVSPFKRLEFFDNELCKFTNLIETSESKVGIVIMCDIEEDILNYENNRVSTIAPLCEISPLYDILKSIKDIESEKDCLYIGGIPYIAKDNIVDSIKNCDVLFDVAICRSSPIDVSQVRMYGTLISDSEIRRINNIHLCSYLLTYNRCKRIVFTNLGIFGTMNKPTIQSMHVPYAYGIAKVVQALMPCISEFYIEDCGVDHSLYYLSMQQVLNCENGGQ